MPRFNCSIIIIIIIIIIITIIIRRGLGVWPENSIHALFHVNFCRIIISLLRNA